MAFLRFTGRQSPARHEDHKYFVSTRPGRPLSVLSDETLVSRTIVSADKVAGRRRKFGDKLRSLLRGDRDKAKAAHLKAKVVGNKSSVTTLPKTTTTPVSSSPTPQKAAAVEAAVSPSPSSACSDGFMFWHDPSDNLTPVTSHESFGSMDMSLEEEDVLEQLAEVPRCYHRISKSASQSSMTSQLTIPNSVSCTSQLSAIAVSAFSDSGSDSGMSDSATCFGAEELDYDAKDAYNLGDWGLPLGLTDGYSDSEDEDDLLDDIVDSVESVYAPVTAKTVGYTFCLAIWGKPEVRSKFLALQDRVAQNKAALETPVHEPVTLAMFW
ncbi:hypothetical protein CJU90_1873 [Yarrowia sp. C11]|nr:hypothetical protein CKK34_5901 [Yarrowia sp. E02]KAG5371810.1 hypothetical protein CJU90_1873 [Yarrowia sp. C11]